MDEKQAIMSMIVMAGQSVKNLSAEIGVSSSGLHSRINAGTMRINLMAELADRCGFDLMLEQRPSNTAVGEEPVKIRIDCMKFVGNQMRIRSPLTKHVDKEQATSEEKIVLWENVGEQNNKLLEKYYGYTKEKNASYKINEDASSRADSEVALAGSRYEYKGIKEENIITAEIEVKPELVQIGEKQPEG